MTLGGIPLHEQWIEPDFFEHNAPLHLKCSNVVFVFQNDWINRLQSAASLVDFPAI
jgi:hypothetical protein